MARKTRPVPPWIASRHEPGAHFGHYEQLPDMSRPAYATVRLSFNPAGSPYVFEPGDRVDEILPADLLATCIRNGEVSYDKPEAD